MSIVSRFLSHVLALCMGIIVQIIHMQLYDHPLPLKNGCTAQLGSQAATDSTAQLGSQAFTVNSLDGKSYLHHPVMLAIPIQHFKPSSEYLVEPGGLFIPTGFDCTNFRKALGKHSKHANWSATQDEFPYFVQVPARAWKCRLHEITIASNIISIVPTPPIIDDEYYEHVAVFQSAMRQHGNFNIVEMGARWGTWGSRGAALHRALHPSRQHQILFFEMKPLFCQGIEEMIATNNLTANLICNAADASSFARWVDDKDHVDLVDMDIQRAESDLVPKIKSILDAKVFRLIIGTHTHAIHKSLKMVMRDWIILHDMRPTRDLDCVKRFFWTQKFKDVLKSKYCFERTIAHGPVCNVDGELILDNPRFVDPSKRLDFSSRVLQIQDLW